ncbi:Spc98 family-domain-containing protein [Calycina marina]|uniref:Spindle pole body component n=1 Tax=Calycina marina TaxID=1763456 RepID=A0A9P7YY00_9HELO|nr:Spc98 family-domain-containing protein [Calycina marina]
MDLNDEETGLVFAIPDLYGPSRWLLEAGESSETLFSELRLDDVDQKLPEVVKQMELKHGHDNSFFRIPDFNDGLSESLSTPESPTRSDDHDHVAHKEDDYDIWLLPIDTPVVTANFQSWDSFDDFRPKNASISYITEAGADIFDAAIESPQDDLNLKNSDCSTIDARQFAASIFALGLGRSSVLFTWNAEKLTFKPTLARMRITGRTVESVHSVSAIFLECGNVTKSLQLFVEKTYSERQSPSQIALAEAVSTLLSTIQSCIGRSASRGRSVLQLQTMFKPVHALLICFARIVKSTARTPSDESTISKIYAEIQLREHSTDDLKDLLIEILRRVSNPWLEFVSEWLGLQAEAGVPLTKNGIGKSFVGVTDREWADENSLKLQEKDFVLKYDKIPSFIAPEDARTIFEVGKNFRVLRSHYPDHPLARSEFVASVNPPPLEWRFSWQDVLAVESKALKYERDLKEVINRLVQPEPNPGIPKAPWMISEFELEFFGKPEEDMQVHILASIDTFNMPLHYDLTPDRLSLALERFLGTASDSNRQAEELFSPPTSLIPVLAFNPLVAAQARVVNAACMKMFFKSHRLRQHLSIQRTFHLFGNGLFSSRLSHALFDPDMESAERHRGVARAGGVMGLRLGGRDTWPPASSELQLALMGVLTECYVSNKPLQKADEGTYLEKILPGDLSFAVRDMSEEEIERCRNADSIEALDFLRLSYKPPSPLEAVITPTILSKYDEIFKLLLRILRMLYVVSSLFIDARVRNASDQSVEPDTQRFRIEAQHFVTSISSYFFDTGIDCTWRIFEHKLDELEARINSDDDSVTLGQNEGLDQMRGYHERVLDRMMFALLLRKRQQPVMHLLEEIFTLILQFSKASNQRSLSEQGDVEFNLIARELYKKFARKLGVFITVCRGLSEKKGYGEKKINTDRRAGGLFDGDDLVEENTIAHLLGRLEMSGYYARTVKS